MGNKIEVSIDQGLDVPNIFKDVPDFVKDVPNFVNDVSNFVNDVPKVPMFVLRRGNDLQSLPKGSQRIMWTMRK